MIQNAVIQKQASVGGKREHSGGVRIPDGNEVLIRINIVGNIWIAVHKTDVLKIRPVVDHKAEGVTAQAKKDFQKHGLGKDDVVPLEHRFFAGNLKALLKFQEFREIIQNAFRARIELDDVPPERKILAEGKALSRPYHL